MAERPAIAFLGLGTMGTVMVRWLHRAGLRTTVYNRGRAPAEALAAEGVDLAASPREAAAEADVVIAMLTDDAASRAVWEGEPVDHAGPSSPSQRQASASVRAFSGTFSRKLRRQASSVMRAAAMRRRSRAAAIAARAS